MCFNRNIKDIFFYGTNCLGKFWIFLQIICCLLCLVSNCTIFFINFFVYGRLREGWLLHYVEYGKSVNFYAFFEDKFLQT